VSFETTRDAFRAGAYDYLYRPPDESILRQLAHSLTEREMQQRQLEYVILFEDRWQSNPVCQAS
jgi:PleD family two-component response regulator